MKKRKIICMYTMISVLTLMLCACVSKTAEAIKVGNDEVLTLFSAVGERKITGTEKGFKNDTNYMNLIYGNGDVTNDDVNSFVEMLKDDGYLTIEDSETEIGVGTIQMEKSSVDEGKIVTIHIAYSQDSEQVTISYKTIHGALTL